MAGIDLDLLLEATDKEILAALEEAGVEGLEVKTYAQGEQEEKDE